MKGKAQQGGQGWEERGTKEPRSRGGFLHMQEENMIRE